MTHKLENNYTKQVFALLQNFYGPQQISQPENPTKGLRTPQGIWLWKPMGYDYRTSIGRGKQTLGGYKQKLVHQDPGERSSDPTRDWARLAFECPEVSRGGVGGQWPAAGSGHWIKPSWEPQHAGLRPFEGDPYYNNYPTAVWPQDKIQGWNPAPAISRKFSSVQLLSCVRLFMTPWTAAFQASLSITNTQSLLKLMSIESVMPPNHLILCYPFSSCPQSFPASSSYPMTQFFSSGGQSVGASASVLPITIQEWFPLGLTGWISLLSKGPSRVSSNTIIQSINSSTLSFLYGPCLTSIPDYWKKHSFDYMDPCQSSNVSTF